MPQQFMPLPEATPDLHSPIEHLVRSVKACVRDKLMDGMSDPATDVLSGATYQAWLNEAVLERCNGECGMHALRRSIEKQLCICQILSTPLGEKVWVRYVFGDDGVNATGKKKEWHEVRGTGGGWITDSRFT